MLISEMLNEKGRDIFSIRGDASLAESAAMMKDRNVSALLVDGDKGIDGIITERDIVNVVAGHGGDLTGLKASDIMIKSSEIIVAEPDDESMDVMAVMVQKGIRHMPVVESGLIVGVISIRDLVRANVMKLNARAHFLSEYLK